MAEQVGAVVLDHFTKLFTFNTFPTHFLHGFGATSGAHKMNVLDRITNLKTSFLGGLETV